MILLVFYTRKCTYFCLATFRSSHRRCSVRKGVFRDFAKFTGKYPCQSLFFNKVVDLSPATLLKKETLAQVFSCEFCKISTNTFFYRTPPVAASDARSEAEVFERPWGRCVLYYWKIFLRMNFLPNSF